MTGENESQIDKVLDATSADVGVSAATAQGM